MSVLIKDMDKPKSCYEVIDGEPEYCPFLNTDDDCVLLLKEGICEGTWTDQYSKCPLVEEPERKIKLHGDESAIEILSELRSWFSCFDEKEGLAYHALSLAIRAIKANSTAERKKGKWMRLNDIDGFVRCSSCGTFWDYSIIDTLHFHFCPRCGSYNGGEEDDSV